MRLEQLLKSLKNVRHVAVSQSILVRDSFALSFGFGEVVPVAEVLVPAEFNGSFGDL